MQSRNLRKCICFCAKDKTLLEGASDTAVVEASLIKIKTACIFCGDNYFVRRQAHVETNDGTDDGGDFNGGIWKVLLNFIVECRMIIEFLSEQIKT